jgi:hypothetical protein
VNVQDEFAKLIADIAGKDIALQIGPDGKATLMGEVTKGLAEDSAKAKIQQDVQSMKDFMGKTVEQLAATTDKLDALDVIKVRDRRLVVTSNPSRGRTESILVACLYALQSPNVDAILGQANVQGHFQLEDGTVAIQPFVTMVYNTPDKEVKKKEAPKVEPETAKRNILVGGEEPKREFVENGAVLLLNSDADPDSLGTVVSVDKETEGCEVVDMYGNTKSMPWTMLKPVNDVADAAHWAAEIIKAKAKKLTNNG